LGIAAVAQSASTLAHTTHRFICAISNTGFFFVGQEGKKVQIGRQRYSGLEQG
jgi:hypothetical protein